MSTKRKILLLGGLLAAACCVIPSHGSERDELPKIAQTLGEQHAASPRVVCSTGGSGYSAGTGTVFGKTKREYTVGTNARVVEGSNSITCQFFGDGRPVCVDAKLVGKFYDSARGLDFAFLAASRSALDAYNPPVPPRAPRRKKAEARGRGASVQTTASDWRFGGKRQKKEAERSNGERAASKRRALNGDVISRSCEPKSP